MPRLSSEGHFDNKNIFASQFDAQITSASQLDAHIRSTIGLDGEIISTRHDIVGNFDPVIW